MDEDLERSEFFGLWRIKTESAMHKAAQRFVADTWCTSPGRFPGPQPISIERCHFDQLRRRPYLVCEKTDGVRYMLVCFEYLAKKVCVLINRAFECVVVPLTVPRGTVLDGELVQLKTGQWRYLVYDAVLVRGEDVRQKSLTERLAAATSVTRSIIRSAKDPFEVRTKTMLPVARFGELPALDAFPYGTDGLVFTPVDAPIQIGTHETMFKWKPRGHITVDFMLRDNILHIQDQGHFLRVTTMYPPSKFVGGTILECGYGETGWYVVRVRTDKTHPNNKRTYQRTIVNLQENIQIEEFAHVFANVL
jgi:hypothetical protein